MKIYVFDIDGTICTNTYGDYELAKPFNERIEFINTLYNDGNIIKYFTARGSGTGIDWYDLTKNQLDKWGAKYHNLTLGKPEGDFYIDDKGLEANTFFDEKLNPINNYYFAKIARNFSLLHNDPLIYENIDSLAKEISNCFKTGGKLIFAGNGGSFADAQHLSAEFTSRLKQDRQPLPSIVLGANSSSITAIGNDYGFDKVFCRELESLANYNDILISITTSGESQNIYELIKSANKIPIRNWCLTSYKNSKCSRITKSIKTPDKVNEVANIQELHIAIGHLLCMRTEYYFFK
tara:strand:- start:605 stop:1483 length:879 start_codon:yes stop_codon:yes gene_type:complete